MIFPNKYLKFNKTLINLGALIIKNMKKGCWYSVDEIWGNIKYEAGIKPYNFNDFVLTFDFLYLVNTIKMNREGKLCLN